MKKIDIEKVHTTQMGEERIRRNINLQSEDVISWCKEFIASSDTAFGLGKNWYVYGNGIVLTINAYGFSVITAHKIKAKIRVMQISDYECLPKFLYQAIYIPDGEEMPPREMLNDPNINVYANSFGAQPGDLGVVARCQVSDQIIGAAWTRIIPACGHVNKYTPELVVSILPPFRNYGMGTKLMKKLFDVLRKNGYKQTSLSVQKNNPAVRFYQRLGYAVSGERFDHAGHEDYLMIMEL